MIEDSGIIEIQKRCGGPGQIDDVEAELFVRYISSCQSISAPRAMLSLPASRKVTVTKRHRHHRGKQGFLRRNVLGTSHVKLLRLQKSRLSFFDFTLCYLV